MAAEIHLFILWERVGPARETILHRIAAEFEVLRVFSIRWSPALFSDNLSRFYGQKLPPGCNKEESCGSGPFTLVVVRDPRPDYGLRETTHGPARVNLRTFDLKGFFRSPAGGSLPIHATDTMRETAHDLALLLGVGVSGFVTAYPGPWTGKIDFLRRDISGARGWASLGEFFGILNETVDYIVLRNFECLPEHYHLESHGDIDLLVGSYVDACLVANAAPVFDDPCRVHRTVVIGGQPVPFDFRYVGDDYYDERWQRRMIEARQLVEGGFFVPDPESHFYGLLYHAAVHKPRVAPDYADRLVGLAASLAIDLPGGPFFDDARQLRAFLLSYMRPRGYRFTRPLDASVYCNKAVALGSLRCIADRIWSRKRKVASAVVPKIRTVPRYDLRDERLIGASRTNLLRPFDFVPGQRVLELGCEAGMLSRYLGETGADVFAVESLPGLAAEAVARCRDFPNVRIFCDDPLTFEADGLFDVAMLIGTSERVAAGDEGGDPLGALLLRTAGMLKPDGMLILAINNQLGLKYFAGCPDECSGIAFYGINDLYRQGEPASVGRQVLAAKLAGAGFGAVEFLFPFPDYRMPGLILSEPSLQDPRLNIADLLVRNIGLAYPENGQRAFAEALAWKGATRNGMLPELANSFLVVARRDASSMALSPTWLAKIYSRGLRRPCYRFEGTIVSDKSGELLVRKRQLFAGAVTDGNAWLRHRLADSTYLSGELLIARIHSAMAREAGIEELAASFSPWLKYLQMHARVDERGERVLPEDFVDCIPDNLIEAPSGELNYFDAEWVAREPIPIAWTVVRGMVCALAGCIENRTIGEITYRQLIRQVAAINGIFLHDGDFAVADRCEARLVAQYDAMPEGRRRFAELIDTPVQMIARFSRSASDYHLSLAWHQAELARVKSTVSWRITGPLRASWNLLRRLALPCYSAVVSILEGRGRLNG